MKTPIEHAKEFALGVDAALIQARLCGAPLREIEQLQENARAARWMYQQIAAQQDDVMRCAFASSSMHIAEPSSSSLRRPAHP